MEAELKLLFVADGRSPIALNWIGYFVETGHEVHLVSTFPCSPDLRLASLHEVPVAFSGVKAGERGGQSGAAVGEKGNGGEVLRRLIPVGLRTAFRQWMGPFTLRKAAERLEGLVAAIQPDLVHAMRIPFEGMLAALALEAASGPPLLISVWGNDFTLHARATAQMAAHTRLVLGRAAALHTDCKRDLRLAHDWGFPDSRPAVVLPGGGGVQLDIFHPQNQGQAWEGGAEATAEPVVINPRGYRAYVRNDTFFKAVPRVIEVRPETRFICPQMAGEAQAERWVEELGISDQVELLPRLPRPQMADLFRRSLVAVSPSTHDGTPNTLLEAMACGCFPVAGDLESIREWITPGVNGLLVDPGDPHALAGAILLALQQAELRRRAADYNARLIIRCAEHRRVMVRAEEFYRGLLRPGG